MNRNLLIIISVLWILVGIWYYTTVTTGNSDHAEIVDSDTTGISSDSINPATKNQPPVSFNFEESNPIQGSGFENWLDSLDMVMGDKDTLKIIGLYYSGENNGELIATSRSLATQRLLSERLDKTRLIVDFSETMEPPPTGLTVEGVKIELHPLSVIQEKTSEGLIVPFRKNSVVRLEEAVYNEQLQQLASRVKSMQGFSIDVVAHTSQSSDPDKDYELGRKRAWVIKKYLMDSGVDPARIVTDSKGSQELLSSDPSSVSNDRVEVILNLNSNTP